MSSKSREPGAPVEAGFVPLSVPNISGREWEYVKQCLDTGWVSSVGSFVDRFEREFAAAVGAPHAVAVASGTASLHVALQLAGVGVEDEVILPALTFIAPANAVRYLGAFPVFLDVDAEIWELDPVAVERFLREDCRREGDDRVVNRHTGRRVRALLPVDILGHPADLDPLHALAEEFGLSLVEDATESLGATYRGRPLGSRSELTCFSFNGNKLLTTGGGGMLVTTNAVLAKRARYLTTQAKDDPIEFIHGEVGYNYRLTNVQAAIGCAQLERLDEFLSIKRRISERYAEAWNTLPGFTPQGEADWATSALWLYSVRVDADTYGRGARELVRALDDEGVQARPLWQPLHRSPALRGSWSAPCPVTDQLHGECISLPCSTGLTEMEQDRVINALIKLRQP